MQRSHAGAVPGLRRAWAKGWLPFLGRQHLGQCPRGTGNSLAWTQAGTREVGMVHAESGDPLSPCNEVNPYRGQDAGPSGASLSDG